MDARMISNRDTSVCKAFEGGWPSSTRVGAARTEGFGRTLVTYVDWLQFANGLL